MGGRGTFASGIAVPYAFETVGFVDGMKVLKGIGPKHGLPEESHMSSAYVQLNRDGTVRTIRFYDKNHNVRLEIAKHPEGKLDPSQKPVLHYHTYQPGFRDRSDAKPLTKAMKKRYARLFERSWK